eukprot:Mycagemm_TRINITY_DN10299_c1_g4::TRINITY_DN10299_c1_g4_i1::g.3918::m.3918 type:complete len:111 gc:universal TRINITY_DN10299_c1_g4_i1:710-378(-)
MVLAETILRSGLQVLVAPPVRGAAAPLPLRRYQRRVRALSPLRSLRWFLYGCRSASPLPSLALVSARSGSIPMRPLRSAWRTLARTSASSLRTVSLSASPRLFTFWQQPS